MQKTSGCLEELKLDMRAGSCVLDTPLSRAYKPTLVLATPISGPALMWTPQSVSREIELPTVLVIPTLSAPLFLQYCRAIKVSAVSPDWLKQYHVLATSQICRLRHHGELDSYHITIIVALFRSIFYFRTKIKELLLRTKKRKRQQND